MGITRNVSEYMRTLNEEEAAELFQEKYQEKYQEHVAAAVHELDKRTVSTLFDPPNPDKPPDADRRADVVESLVDAALTYKPATYFIKDESTPEDIEARIINISVRLTFEPRNPEDK